MDSVLSAVSEALTSDVEADWLTFSGNGESTVHPDFPAIVRGVRGLVDEIRPGLRIALLTNASTVTDAKVTTSFDWIDFPILKLDAGDQTGFKRINRPLIPRIRVEELIERLREISAGKKLTLQSVLFDGDPTNVRGRAYRNWIKAVEYIKPDAVQLYSLDYQVGSISPIDVETLDRIASEVSGSGVQAITYIEERS